MPDKKSVRSQFLYYMSCAVCSFFLWNIVSSSNTREITGVHTWSEIFKVWTYWSAWQAAVCCL